jgi:hypothetical protein
MIKIMPQQVKSQRVTGRGDGMGFGDIKGVKKRGFRLDITGS